MTPIAPTSFPVRAAAIAALAAALAVAGVAPASGQGVDLRSPDARDAGTTTQPTYVDLRSPDARDAERAGAQPGPAVTDSRHGALGATDARDAQRAAGLGDRPDRPAAAPNVDLRSPDARDAGRQPNVDLRSPDARDAGRPTATPASSQPVAQPATPDSDDWLIPAIVGAALALMLATLLTARRRRRHHAVA
jgi:MYXO-CTERM domain-containing protein